MRQLVWLVTIVTAAVVVAGQDDDGYTDENRPYKFGFNIQGHQHRKEEKDENGIINGEYGFITADGYYRVTVYKTDEKGDFKIVSMKNYYVGFPPEDPTTTAEPERARNPIRKLAFPSQAAAAPAIPARPLKIAPQPPLTTTTAAPTQPPATATFTGAPACSSCFLPPTTAKPSPSVISNSSPKKPSSVIAQNGPKPGFLQQNQGVKPGSPTFPRNPSLGSSNLVGPLPNNGASSGGKPGSDPGLTPDRRMPQGPQGSVPNTRVPPRPSSQSNQPIQQGSRPLRPLGQSQPGSKQNIPLVQDNQPFRPIGQVNQGTPPSQDNRESFRPIGQVNQGTPPSQNNRESFGPIGQVNQGTPPSQNSRERDQAPQKLGPRVEDPSAAKQSTSTQGGAGEENGLLYRFNYTVGFHGHHEDGYRNGDKTGDYFVSGRDGVSRKVEYLANEFGYQPNITLVQLDRSDERVPKEESEKNYGLKGYEFKWFLRK